MKKVSKLDDSFLRTFCKPEMVPCETEVNINDGGTDKMRRDYFFYV